MFVMSKDHNANMNGKSNIEPYQQNLILTRHFYLYKKGRS